eukprot:PhM_4_TR16702/c0_g1_i1/m.57999
MGSGGSKLLDAKSICEGAELKGKNVLCLGATAGIGEAVAMRLARGGANVTIVGRNITAGNKIVGEMRALNPSGEYNFVQADLMLLKCCKKVCSDYVASHDRLDLVVFTQTKATLQGRTLTSEGIDEKLCLNFYSRVYMTKALLPLLCSTADRFGSDVRVMSVLAAGVHKAYAHWKDDTRVSSAR